MSTSPMPRERAVFCVNEEPYCLWDPDIQRLTIEFLDRIDPEYFEHIADIHSKELTGQEKHRSATMLRFAFFHGLETFFSLTCATLQAPDCIPSWMQKYSNSQLRTMVSMIDTRQAYFPCKLKITKPSWSSIAQLLFQKVDVQDEEKNEYIRLFAKLWHRFAEIFVDERSIAEYNSIKHGFRTGSGGFSLAMGIETIPGVPAPPENMHLLGSSEFGHSFYQPQLIGEMKANPNFQLVRHSVAWNPNGMATALELISSSIKNIISFIKMANGISLELINLNPA